MRYTLAVVLVLLLFVGTTMGRANEVESAVSAPRLPRIVEGTPDAFERVPEAQLAEWQQQLAAGKPICPTVQELHASRQQLAREAATTPNPTEAYKIALAKQGQGWLARCRAQVEWAASVLKQTPEGRAYLARIGANVLNQLRLNADPNGAWAVFDTGPGGAPIGTGQCLGGCIFIDRERMWDLAFMPSDPASLTPSQTAALMSAGAGTLAVLVGLGIITGAVYIQIAAVLGALGAIIQAAVELGIIQNRPDREPER